MSILVRNVSKRFGDFVALDDVTVEVESGSLTALLGPSSAVSDPDGIASETSSRAWKPPKRLETSTTVMPIARSFPSA